MATTADSCETTQLACLIEQYIMRPFAWGESDCCLSVCNVLRDSGFTDLAVGYRGRYDDVAGARGVMQGTVEDVAVRETARAGWSEINLEDARDLDMGIYANSLMIRSGDWWIGKSESGALFKRTVRRAWRPA